MLKSVSSYFDVADLRIRTIVRIPASTASRLEKKLARTDPGATERIYKMGTVTRNDWMRQPNRVFGNAAPLDLMDTDPGAILVIQLCMRARRYGAIAAACAFHHHSRGVDCRDQPGAPRLQKNKTADCA